MARCCRCGAVLYRRRRHGADATLALTLTAAVLFVLANAFPLVGLDMQGQQHATSLWGAIQALWERDVWLLSLLVFATTMLLPAFDLGAMLWLLVPLALGRRPLAGMQVMRALIAIKPWGMVEVFVLGVLVALVKLGHIATVEPGVALWSFGGLILVFAAAVASFDTDLAWAQLAARR
jgi:paraquat-inducible protein A